MAASTDGPGQHVPAGPAARQRPGGLVLLFALVACAVVVSAVVIPADRPDAVHLISGVGLCTMALSAAAACLRCGLGMRGKGRAGWCLVGLGMLSWALGQAYWVFYETTIGPVVPFASWADVGFIGMLPLTATGLLLPVITGVAQRLRALIDGVLVAASLLLMSWMILVRDFVAARGEQPLALTVSLVYPIGDVILITVVVYLLAAQGNSWRAVPAIPLVGSGLITFVVADVAFAFFGMIGSYDSGSLIDIGWCLGFALILVGATTQMPGTVQPPPMTRAPGGALHPVGVLLPYVAVLGALIACVIKFPATGRVEPFVGIVWGVVIVLIVVRQVLTLLENRGLTRHLEARVAARTAELSASEKRFQALVQHSSDVLSVVDADTVVLYESESVHRVFGYPADAFTGNRMAEMLGARPGAQLTHALQSLVGRPYASTVLEMTVKHHDGRLRMAEMTVTNLLDDPNVGGFVLNTRDISESRQLQDQLVHEAHHDALTQLANRAMFHDRVQAALRGSRRTDDVAVLFLDLDGFKEVNDSLGHAAGDELLVRVAERLRLSVREDDLVARLGGDEFAVLVQSIVATTDARSVADRIVTALREPFVLAGREIHIAASIGLACAGDAADAEQLMRNADLAMYEAKSAGGGSCTTYHPEMLTGLVARLELEADLRRALERDELVLNYQPTVDLHDGRIFGFEALLRWQHPTRGDIAPLDFIPLAEATGLIEPIGRWVLTEACRQAVAWTARGGLPLKMAVNVSARQLERADLPEIVAAALAASGMPAGQLCLEMTESILMNDTEETLGQLQALKRLGVTLAIDDFGTGYSSLAYLRRFPVDILKIDRSFVERLGARRTDADSALVTTIVQLAHSLGMTTVAEGIEEPSQWAELRAIGCDSAQGYYFSRPVPAAEADALLDAAGPMAVLAVGPVTPLAA
jgi:diguanylate cyclase (GGDEF)-like protein/PAS domain S-box-containing protein